MPKFKASFTVNGSQPKEATVKADSQTEAYQKLCSQAAVKFPGSKILVLAVKEQGNAVEMPEFFKAFFG